jgi:hypothetical protein
MKTQATLPRMGTHRASFLIAGVPFSFIISLIDDIFSLLGFVLQDFRFYRDDAEFGSAVVEGVFAERLHALPEAAGVVPCRAVAFALGGFVVCVHNITYQSTM